MSRKKLKYQNAASRHLTARTGAQVSILPLLLNELHQKEVRTELPSLTPARASELYEDWRRGCMADVQRAWDELEQYDEDLAVVVDKRQRALEQMPWQVEIDAAAVGDAPTLRQLAEAQQAWLASCFNAVDNLQEAVTYLGMADFHGVAALELTGHLRPEDGEDGRSPHAVGRMRWEVIEPWLLHRPTRRSAWFYNPDAANHPTTLEELDEEAVIIREARPISLPVMFLVAAKHHAINGWDVFLEVFGSPSIFAELPPGTSEQDAAIMDELVKRIISDGRGTIPAGTKFTTVETAATNCTAFMERAKWCREAIITLGTGGQLTVMSAPGSGTLAGGAHENSFENIMAGTAAGISAIINRQFSRRMLAEAFPGQPMLARFSLAPEPADERAAMAELLGKITAAGYELQTDEAASELTGLPLRRVPSAPSMVAGPAGGAPIANACNQHGHEPGCPDAQGGTTPADADPSTAQLSRPEDDPEPEGGWLDDEEDPNEDATAPTPAAPVPVEEEPPSTPAAPKSWARRAGEKALAWMSRFTLPGKYARRAYEKKHGPIANRETEPAPEPPLTAEELAAFASLQTPNLERMNQRRSEVEAALRAAADLPPGESAEEDIENGKRPCRGKNPMDCRRCNPAMKAATRHTQKGGRASAGNPAGKPTQSNTPLKAADGATPSEQRRAVSKALAATRKGGEVQDVFRHRERGGGRGRPVTISAGKPGAESGGGSTHLWDKHINASQDMTPQTAASAIVDGPMRMNHGNVASEQRGTIAAFRINGKKLKLSSAYRKTRPK